MSRKHESCPKIREVGLRIRFHRRRHKWTQLKLAELSGISLVYLGGIESRGRNPTMKTLFKVALALEVAPAQLMPGFEKDRVAIKVALQSLAEEFDLNDDEIFPC